MVGRLYLQHGASKWSRICECAALDATINLGDSAHRQRAHLYTDAEAQIPVIFQGQKSSW